MSTDDKVKLLHGPYLAPALSIGDPATCLFKDCDVVITSWTDAPISWPKCQWCVGSIEWAVKMRALLQKPPLPKKARE